jgi:hypothetical protein
MQLILAFWKLPGQPLYARDDMIQESLGFTVNTACIMEPVKESTPTQQVCGSRTQPIAASPASGFAWQRNPSCTFGGVLIDAHVQCNLHSPLSYPWFQSYSVTVNPGMLSMMCVVYGASPVGDEPCCEMGNGKAALCS